MKKIAFLYIFILAGLSVFAQQNDISSAFKTANYKELSNFFNTNIEINIFDNEGLYSRTQAVMIIKDFFQKNVPTNFTSKYTGFSKDGSKYSIGNLETSTGNFKTYFFFKKDGDNFLVNELRIEKEK